MKQERQQVIGLAFHVDYWNYLHWHDPFSSAAYTQRQYQYAAAMGGRGIYTPQMIVNGRYAFVGSSRYKGRNYIERALSEAPEAKVNLEVKSVTPDRIQVAYSVSENPDHCVLQLALVERDIVRKIGSGENSGRTLEHQNVVRFFKTMSLERNQKGIASLEIPSNLIRKNSSIIAYVQHADNMKILGAIQQRW